MTEEGRPYNSKLFLKWLLRICVWTATLLVLLECAFVVVACIKQMDSFDDWGLIPLSGVAVMIAACQVLAVKRKSETYSNIVGYIFAGLSLFYCGCMAAVLPTAHDDGDWETIDTIYHATAFFSWTFIGCTMLAASRFYARQKEQFRRS